MATLDGPLAPTPKDEAERPSTPAAPGTTAARAALGRAAQVSGHSGPIKGIEAAMAAPSARPVRGSTPEANPRGRPEGGIPTEGRPLACGATASYQAVPVAVGQGRPP